MLVYTLIATAAGLVLAAYAARRNREKREERESRERLGRWADAGGAAHYRMPTFPHGHA